MEKLIQEYISKHRLIRREDSVLVGLSGGADSVALLRVLLSLGYRCVAVHCNFHLRGEESNRDQHFVEELCNTLNVPLEIPQYDTVEYASRNKISIEMAARNLRYADFETLRQRYGCAVIAVAHHRDDSVETVLLNLIRGTGIRGLTGIKPRNGAVVRPLLTLSREDIESYLRTIGQEYITDSTNLQSDYKRNKIRLQLLPLMRSINPRVDDTIERMSHYLSETEILYSAALNGLKTQVLKKREGTIRIDIDSLLQSGVVHTLLHEILSPYGFNESQINDIESSIDGTPGRQFKTAGYTLYRERKELILIPDNMVDSGFCALINLERDNLLQLPDGGNLLFRREQSGAPISSSRDIATLDAERVGTLLTVRYANATDWFVPFGMRGKKSVSKYMSDKKMDIAQRMQQYVVCSNEDIIWLVAQRTDNRYRITRETATQLIISYTPPTEGKA